MKVATILLTLPALALAGCSVFYTADAGPDFGVAVKGSTAAQVANPGPAQRTEVPLALDGEASKLLIENYYASFEKPPAPVNVFNIGVGTRTSTAR